MPGIGKCWRLARQRGGALMREDVPSRRQMIGGAALSVAGLVMFTGRGGGGGAEEGEGTGARLSRTRLVPRRRLQALPPRLACRSASR